MALTFASFVVLYIVNMSNLHVNRLTCKSPLWPLAAGNSCPSEASSPECPERVQRKGPSQLPPQTSWEHEVCNLGTQYFFSQHFLRGNAHSKRASEAVGPVMTHAPYPCTLGVCMPWASISSAEQNWRDRAHHAHLTGLGEVAINGKSLGLARGSWIPKCETWEGFQRPSVQVLPHSLGETEAQRDGKGLVKVMWYENRRTRKDPGRELGR